MRLTQGDPNNKPLELVDRLQGIYRLRVGAHSRFDGEKEIIEWMEEDYPSKPSLDEIKLLLISSINHYDSSDAVNQFKINGITYWLDKATRVGLVNSTSILKAAGETTTKLWLNGNPIVVDCDTALNFLYVLERYALKCYDVTCSHIAAINALESESELLEYDITKDYPEVISVEV